MLSTFKRTERAESQPSLTPTHAPTEQPQASNTSRAAPETSIENTSLHSMLGQDVTVTGIIVSKGYLKIDGHVDADVRAHKAYIGPNARVIGCISANEIEVRGYVEGTIRAAHVCLGSSSHVDGDIYHSTLSIEEGAYFEGKCRRVSAENYAADPDVDQVARIREVLDSLHNTAPSASRQNEPLSAPARASAG